MNEYKPKEVAFLNHAYAAGYKPGHPLNYKMIDALIGADGTRPWWLINDKAFRGGRGIFILPDAELARPTVAKAPKAPKAPKAQAPVIAPPEAVVVPLVAPAPATAGKVKRATGLLERSAIPAVFKNYVKFGHFADVQTILESRMFYPVFITGLSGNGKTMMVEQAAAKAGRELFRVNITVETDEDDLLGGFRLVDGETQWVDGPVTEAARRGAVLLLDEIDLASSKIMCLQPVLEGKEFLLKKVLDIVTPAPGFTVVATANTKGKGSESGMFVGTNVLNEAFLERFPITMEQEYPAKPIETKILINEMKDISYVGADAKEFAKTLVSWADGIRKTFEDGGIEEIITTRRLVHIVKAFGIFADREKAVTACIARFDDDTRASFMDLYKMHVPAAEADEDAAEAAAEAPGTEPTENIPF